MTTRLSLDEPAGTPRRGTALFALGFRPFYLLASTFAALSVPLWALQFAGVLRHPYLAGPIWHAHEMLFGFALAVVVGFLYTAGRNWTGLPTPTGWPLGALAALWIAGRILVLTPWSWAAAAANVAFPLAAAVGLAVPMLAARNRRNYFFVVLLASLGLAAGVVHLAQLEVLAVPARLGLGIGLDLLLFIVAVMGGRVIPMFTNNGVAGASAARDPIVEKAALGSVLALLAVDALGGNGWLTAVVAAAAAFAHTWRWIKWQPWKTLGVPLVWVLQIGYAWVPLHLLLRSLAARSVSSHRRSPRTR